MRLLFIPNKQSELINLAKTNSGLTWNKIAEKLQLNECYIRTSLKSEKCTISIETFEKLCNLANVSIDEWLCFVKGIRNNSWGSIKGGKIGGKFHKSTTKVNIKEPKLSNKLAEFIGILLGDGSLSQGQYDCSFVLNKTFDAPYMDYVSKLILNLFEVDCHFYSFKTDAVRMTVYSKKLFEFLVNRLQLPYGNQNKFIPSYLFDNESLVINVLRGIFDTDGSIFLSSKRKIINLRSKYRYLKKDIMKMLDILKIRYHISSDNINITNHDDVKRFLSIVGSSNLKNVIKAIEFYKNKVSIRSDKNLLSKFDAYSSIELPFKCIF